MEGASEHPTKSTSELPHTVGAWPYLGVVYAGWGPQGQRPRLLSICQPDILGTVLTGQDKNTSTSSSKIDRLLDRGAIHIPRERGILWAQPLHQHICVGGDTDRLQITIKPSTTKRTEPQTAQPKPQPQQQINPLAIESIIPTQEPTSDTNSKNPEYVVTKGIIRKLSK